MSDMIRESKQDSASVEPKDDEKTDGRNRRADNDPLRVFLKRADQAAIATILIAAAIVFVVYLFLDYRNRSGWVHIDHTANKQVDHQVDINLADWPEIANLPGIGEELARRIVSHREGQGPFLTVDSLLNVQGIGEAKLEQLKRFVPHSPDGALMVRH